MQLLDACLALTLTLALFASATTLLVELAQRIFRQRVKQLRAMLAAAFDRYLAPSLGAAGADVAALRNVFMEEMAKRHGVADLASGQKDGRTPLVARAETVTADDVLRRLAANPEFKEAFGKMTRDALRPALEVLAAGFARLEDDATTLFAARARFWSYAMGVVLAVVVNVNAIRLLDHYAADPAATAKTLTELTVLQQQIEKPGAAPDANAKPVAAPDAASTTKTPPTDEARIAEAINRLRSLADIGVPVGAAFFPYCTPPGAQQVDTRCKNEPLDADLATRFKVVCRQPWEVAFWVVCVFITGLLIGLGGPFWFDIAVSLGNVRNLLRGSPEKPATNATVGALGATAVIPTPTLEARIEKVVAMAPSAPTSPMSATS